MLHEPMRPWRNERRARRAVIADRCVFWSVVAAYVIAVVVWYWTL